MGIWVPEPTRDLAAELVRAGEVIAHLRAEDCKSRHELGRLEEAIFGAQQTIGHFTAPSQAKWLRQRVEKYFDETDSAVDMPQRFRSLRRAYMKLQDEHKALKDSVEAGLVDANHDW